MVRTSRAFSPCQITGFFRIHDWFADPLKRGSTGAGVCLKDGVTARVTISRGTGRSSVLVRVNGEPLRNPVVSRLVAQHYIREYGPLQVEIEYTSRLPMGCGYGTSGAGALSLSLALNNALDNPLNITEASGVAHTAEVMARTGLGSVLASFNGGLVVRLKPGAPGVGLTKKILVARSLRVVSASYGPIRTSKVLGSLALRDRINTCSRGLTTRLVRSPNSDMFLKLSRNFTNCLSLATARVYHVLQAMEEQDFVASMMMLGESVFCMVDKDIARKTASILRTFHLKPMISEVSELGGHVI